MARRKSGKKIDFTRWTLGSFTSLALSAGSSQAVIITGSSVQSATILRTRGELLVYMDGSQSRGVMLHGAIGLLVQQIGATATSLPLTDAEAPYFWYETFTLGYEEPVTDVVDIPGITSVRKVIDSKSMRILRAEQEVVCIVEQATLGSGGAINVQVDARFLLGQ